VHNGNNIPICDKALRLEQLLVDIGKKMGLWRRGLAFQKRCKQVFGDFDFNGKNMLEIGCGKGLFCIWASIHGANKVIGLEPLADGSIGSHQCYDDFDTIVGHLDLHGIEMLPTKIQDFDCNDSVFDIILSYQSLNHLDEESCIRLRDSTEARDAYQKIFGKLKILLKKGGKFVVVECSNRNFFGDLGFTNPFAKTIEWFKHQKPELWAELLFQCGFENPKISWNSGTKLRRFGVYSIPKVISYFWRSSFRLEMIVRK
jgi:SAM-dependent methyltransferase